MFKNLKFEQVVLFLLVGYIIFNRLVEQSNSQVSLKQVEQKVKDAEALSQKALLRLQHVEEINSELTHEITVLAIQNDATIEEIDRINKRYNLKKDSLNKKINESMYRAKQNLFELQKLQNQL